MLHKETVDPRTLELLKQLLYYQISSCKCDYANQSINIL